MTSAIRRRAPGIYWPTKPTREEFLTPFDQMFDRMLGDFFPDMQKAVGVEFFEKSSYPKVNIIDTLDAITIEAAIPGLSKEDIEIELNDETLTIKGASKNIKSQEKPNYLRRELKKSFFSRSFKLTKEKLDLTQISAASENGLLTVTVPKKTVEKTETKVSKIKLN